MVLLPANDSNQQFRKQLLHALPDRCNHAVIPPWLGTLENWVNETIPLADPSVTVLSEQARRLLFIETLAHYPFLYKDENKWQVTQALLQLFDEISLHNASVDTASETWMDTVQRAYGLEQRHQHLQQEASLIHKLWHAWHKQLHDSSLVDSASAYIQRLRHAMDCLDGSLQFYVTGAEQLRPCEKDFIALLSRSGRCRQFERAAPAADTHYDTAVFVDHVFDHQSAALKQRVDTDSTSNTAFSPPFSLFAASNAEQEANAIDIQVRDWLLKGKQSIGIISEDRKLSRRLRALLERADVPLQDLAGWSLSTTSAAAVLERWLECIEEDFDQRPMLDLCKSHLFGAQSNHDEHLEQVYRLEQDIIKHENIGHGLDRYKKQLGYRLKRLHHWPANAYDAIKALLDHLHDCSESLVELYRAKYKRPLSDHLNALVDSLERLGVAENFQQDSAGIRIMQTLHDMQQSLQHSNPKLYWHDFRSWLGMSLEEQLFSPHTGTSAVQLMTLEQSTLKTFDALVIAAADDEHMPGRASISPFFNQGARKSLGLDDWEQQRDRRLQLFKSALLSAADVLISYKAEDGGEPLVLSSWVEALQHYYSLSTGRSLQNTELSALLELHPAVMVCDSDALPAIPVPPAPVAPPQLAPRRLSAGAHQRLIDCPYQFFSADTLGLKPADEISEELKKSDYGERVHLILQAFHQQVPGQPEPFDEKLSADNRERAIQHLDELSMRVFSTDLEDNSLHRSWLYRWRKHIPAYIDWQIEHQQHWTLFQTEQKLEVTLVDDTTLYGRLDRIDRHQNAQSIIDYKTGRVASQQDVDNGEDVQLVSYALLNDKAEYVSYLSLDETDGKVKTRAQLQHEELASLKNGVHKRLLDMLDMTHQGAPLHAWGDSETCSYCNFSGLCRRYAWKQDEPAADTSA